jgi:hypothetical protein
MLGIVLHRDGEYFYFRVQSPSLGWLLELT